MITVILEILLHCIMQLLQHCWSWIIQVQDKHIFYMQHKVMEHFASILSIVPLWLLYVLLWFSCYWHYTIQLHVVSLIMYPEMRHVNFKLYIYIYIYIIMCK